VTARLGGYESAQSRTRGPAVVLDQEPVEQLETSLRRNSPADTDFGLMVTDPEVQVSPAVGVEDGIIDLLVQLPQPDDHRVRDGRVVDLVVKLGQPRLRPSMTSRRSAFSTAPSSSSFGVDSGRGKVRNTSEGA